jgi:copper chaperone CopZ
MEKEFTLKVEGMTCEHCEHAVNAELEDMVISSKADWQNSTLHVKYDLRDTELKEIVGTIGQTQYQPVVDNKVKETYQTEEMQRYSLMQSSCVGCCGCD